MRDKTGQTLVEFAASAALLTGLLLGAGRILFYEWEKTKCCILVFEKTHAELTHSPDPYPTTRYRILSRATRNGLEGEAWCGSAHEKVRFLSISFLSIEGLSR